MLQIGSKGLWLDEAFSVWLGWQPLPEMLGWIVRIDQHPPLYYILLRFWMALGDRAAVVRAFSALASTLTIPVIYMLGRRLAGRNVGLLSAVILALSPFHVRFAQETRMYALLALYASLAMLALARLLTDRRAAMVPLGHQLRTLRWQKGATWAPIETDLAWIGYVLFTAATVLTHNTAVLFPVAANLFVFGLMIVRWRWPGHETQLQPPSCKNWLLAQASALALWSPWLWPFIVQARRVYDEFWLPSPTLWTVLNALGGFLSAFLPSRIRWAGVIWAMYGLLGMLGVWHLGQRRACHQRPHRRLARLALLLALFLTPLAGELLVSLRRPIFYDRTLIWASIPLYLLLAMGVRHFRYRSYVRVALLILVTVNGLSLREYFTHFEKEGWDDAAAYVARNVEEDDLLLFNATWVQIPFDYYFRHFDQEVEKRGVPVDLFDRGVLEPKMAESDLPRLRALVQGRQRVWLIYSHYWYTDPQGLIPSAMREFRLLKRRRFYGLEVRLYGS